VQRPPFTPKRGQEDERAARDHKREAHETPREQIGHLALYEVDAGGAVPRLGDEGEPQGDEQQAQELPGARTTLGVVAHRPQQREQPLHGIPPVAISRLSQEKSPLGAGFDARGWNSLP
jgi:hypothetical protein